MEKIFWGGIQIILCSYDVNYFSPELCQTNQLTSSVFFLLVRHENGIIKIIFIAGLVPRWPAFEIYEQMLIRITSDLYKNYL